MGFNLKDAIQKRKILPFADGPKIALKELETAKEDLKDAKDVFALNSDLGILYLAVYLVDTNVNPLDALQITQLLGQIYDRRLIRLQDIEH